MEYTLSQVLGLVKQTVDELMGELRFWCVADVVSIQTKGKFTYLELAELDTDGNIVVKTKANIWDSSILTKFTKATGVDHLQLKNQTILFSGRVSFHTLYGFSLTIDELSSEYTKGALATSQQKIVDELTKEGIINKNKLTALGLPPFSLAVISGQTSAGMEDFFAILKDANIAYTVQQYPCAIQGNQAKQEVYEQLQQVKKDRARGKEYCMVCIMRGGGGTSDMLRQNDIDIAREICDMPIPVLVAVGHTQDSSVLEHVAWSHAKTPSEAAYLIIQEYDAYTDSISSLYDAICHTTELIFSRYRVDIPHVMNSITALVQQTLATIQESVHALYESISLYHPNTILAQGYALVRKNDIILRGKDVSSLKTDDKISIETYKSTIHARVESIETKE